VLTAGSGQILTVTFTPADAADFRSVTASVTIDVLPQSTSSPTPTTAVIIGEVPVFRRRLNKHGKPVGKPVLTGFTLDFNTPLAAAAATDPGNYRLNAVTIRRMKGKIQRVAHPVSGFVVSYTAADESVTLELTGNRTFAKGGELAVLPGVADGSGSALGGVTLFSIAPGGKTIQPS
jgi:hypothetical protein